MTEYNWLWSQFIGKILDLNSVIFELEMIPAGQTTSERVEKANGGDSSGGSQSDLSGQLSRHGSQGGKSVLLKGQMRYIDDIKAVVFLCTPV